MKMRWIGITGVLCVVASLVLGAVGMRIFPTAYQGTANGQMMHSRMLMMNGGRLHNGTMLGMMSSGAMSGMMGDAITSDPDRPFDQQFLDDMIAHHQQGVMMTRHMIVDSQRSELQDLAQRIMAAQQREIAQMQQWRREWYGASAVPVQPPMMGGMMGGGMMGMGRTMDRDRMFLEMMIPHHEGAITIAEQALQQAEHPEIKTLAQTIITTQRAEIDEMQRYLQQWYG